jgi:hypothetical protein
MGLSERPSPPGQRSRSWAVTKLLMTLIRSSATAAADEPGSRGALGVISVTDPLFADAAEMFADRVDAGAAPSIRAIGAALHVGQPRAQQVQMHLAANARTLPASASDSPTDQLA